MATSLTYNIDCMEYTSMRMESVAKRAAFPLSFARGAVGN